MRNIPRLLAALTVTTAALAMGPASAITHGDLDGDDHPYVGLMVTRDANGFARCTGTLVSPTVFVTAGHCTYGITEPVQIWFEPGPIDPPPDSTFPAPGNDPCAGVQGYPCQGDVSGEAATYPDFDPDAQTTADVGVVRLDSPVNLPAYAHLPEQDQLDSIDKGQDFTAVGYGMQRNAKKDKNDVAIRQRMVAHPELLKINRGMADDFGFLTSQNASTGGVCIGDSGGPMFLDDGAVIAGVVSYLTNENCKGKAGSFRLDRAGPLNWLRQQLGQLS